ncbi:Phytocyanin domain [Dillenia turbinata]|uniref:Phytocyanin domain n=1 Tax=Dillenia turbinata TaxID=194707 RepID=A0AAN8Z3K8_9MAGN
MASLLNGVCSVLLFIALFTCFQSGNLLSMEFQVGEDNGWAVPSSKDRHYYNEWAAKNRFKVNDTIRFKYKKDSVLAVSEDEYSQCHSAHPIFFSNNGDTVYTLDRPGSFYFISGVAEHCQRGLKMITKVLELEMLPPPQNGTITSPHKNGAPDLAAVSSSNFAMVIVLSLFGVLMV